MWGWTTVEQLGQDLRYAARTMASNRTFTAVAILSLALGIGANTAIYSFVDSILLRSLPVPRPESLVVMKWRARGFPLVSSKGFSTSTSGPYRDSQGLTVGSVFPYPALELFQDAEDLLAGAFCYFGAGRLNITIRGETEAVRGQYVSGDYFAGMGVPATAGRLILTSDDTASAMAVAVLSYPYSRRRFGEAANAVAQSIRINDKPFTVVGVTPPGFFGADPASVPDVYVPMRASSLLQPSSILESVAQQFLDPNYYWIEIMGRLKPGVTRSRVQAALRARFHRFVEASASNEEERSNLPELLVLDGAGGLDSLRRKYSEPLSVLMAMAGVILLIACANIANLLLARAIARRREIAVRLSIGACRHRVIRQLLTESLLLASLGGVLGVAFAFWGIRLVTVLLGIGQDNFTLHAQLNWRVLGVALGLSVLTGLLFGLAPALRATRVDLTPSLKQASAGSVSSAARSAPIRMRLSQMLVAAQVALSLLLLVAAGLFVRTLSNLHAVELGFNRENVLLFDVNPRAAGYERPALNRLYSDLLDRLGQIPGVRAVSMANRPLLSGSGSYALVSVPGVDPPAGATPSVKAPASPGDLPANMAGVFVVGPRFFETMLIPLISGRELQERDGARAPQVAVINQRFATVFGVENPVGRTLTLGGPTNQYEIVGVVGDALFLSLKEDPRPMVYLSSLSRTPEQATYLVRAAGNPLEPYQYGA